MTTNVDKADELLHATLELEKFRNVEEFSEVKNGLHSVIKVIHETNKAVIPDIVAMVKTLDNILYDHMILGAMVGLIIEKMYKDDPKTQEDMWKEANTRVRKFLSEEADSKDIPESSLESQSPE